MLKRRSTLMIVAASVIVGLAPGLALAHPGHGSAVGAAAGFAHPLGGLDHVLAMVAVGLIAALRGGRAPWALPLAFLAMMALGAGLGMAGLRPSFVEAGVLASLAVFGGLVVVLAIVGRSLPVALLAGCVGAFALFHGLAHGAEMPETGSGLAYGLGFLAATALLHAAGLALGGLARALSRTRDRDGAAGLRHRRIG